MRRRRTHVDVADLYNPGSSHRLKGRLVKIWQILAFNGSLILLLSGALPLISLHFIGTFTVSLFDLYRGLTFSISEYAAEWIEAFSSIGAGIFVILILFPVALVFGFASLKFGSKGSLVAGVLGMICWFGALAAILQLRLSLAQSGSPLAGLAAGFIQVGYGVYGGIIGSAVLLASYGVSRLEAEKPVQPSPLP